MLHDTGVREKEWNADHNLAMITKITVYLASNCQTETIRLHRTFKCFIAKWYRNNIAAGGGP